MAVTIILAAAVAVYAGFVIRKKVKDIKTGNSAAAAETAGSAAGAAGGRRRTEMRNEDFIDGSQCQIYTFQSGCVQPAVLCCPAWYPGGDCGVYHQSAEG